MPDKYTNIGSELHISNSLPTAEDIAGYEALTFTEVKGVASIPELGAASSIVTQADLKDGIVRKAHGERDFGGGDVQFREINSDAGQLLLRTVQDSEATFSVKVIRSTGLIEYFKAIAGSYRRNEATTGNFAGIVSAIQVTSAIVEDDSNV